MVVMVSSNVGGISVAMIQHCFQDLHTITKTKSMDQGKKVENMFTQETVWEL